MFATLGVVRRNARRRVYLAHAVGGQGPAEWWRHPRMVLPGYPAGGSYAAMRKSVGREAQHRRASRQILPSENRFNPGTLWEYAKVRGVISETGLWRTVARTFFNYRPKRDGCVPVVHQEVRSRGDVGHVRKWEKAVEKTPASEALRRVLAGKAPGARNTSETVGAVRFRSRAKWVSEANDILGLRRGDLSRILRGWWTPDLTSQREGWVPAWLASWNESGMEFLGGDVIDVESSGDPGSEKYVPPRRVPLFWVRENGGNPVPLFPELLSRLAAIAAFRKRDGVLLSSLKLRALEWCKSEGLPAVWRASVCYTAAVALSGSAAERVAEDRMEALGPIIALDGPQQRWWRETAR